MIPFLRSNVHGAFAFAVRFIGQLPRSSSVEVPSPEDEEQGGAAALFCSFFLFLLLRRFLLRRADDVILDELHEVVLRHTSGLFWYCPAGKTITPVPLSWDISAHFLPYLVWFSVEICPVLTPFLYLFCPVLTPFQ